MYIMDAAEELQLLETRTEFVVCISYVWCLLVAMFLIVPWFSAWFVLLAG